MEKKFFELPATFEMVVWFTDGETVGKATIELAAGEYPRKEKIDELVEKAKEQLGGSGLHICGPHEFGMELLREKTGQRLVIPGPNEWAEPFTS